MSHRIYLCIDLKSFYASVECIDRGLDPLTTNLVVADPSRTEKTICLAVTPSLKAFGIPGRARMFEVIAKVREINKQRKIKNKYMEFSGVSSDSIELNANPGLELSYIVAPPRMAHYIKYSTDIYNIYLKYVSPDDIHVYSVDEVFMDITDYLGRLNMTSFEFAKTILKDVLETTGITATAGIGTNMYLAKIAMDIMAKRMPADENGTRIAELDEMSYRQNLWDHRPITDFWRVGRGYSKKLEENRIYTMGDIARCSLTDSGENMLYKMFGVNAELLIDHAWGYEPCKISDIKAYKPQNSSLSSGQVLHCPYDFQKARIIVREMMEMLSLDMVEKKLISDQIVLTVGYDIENLTDKDISEYYKGEIKTDIYGRRIPKHAHGTKNLSRKTSSLYLLTQGVCELFDEIVDPKLLIRRLNICANNITRESEYKEKAEPLQFDLFSDGEQQLKEAVLKEEQLKKERRLQEAVIEVKHKYGKNAIIKGTNLQEGATAIERNKQIGGHKA